MEEKQEQEMNKADAVELAIAKGFFGPLAGGEQTEEKRMEETDFFAAVESFLDTVKCDPVDTGDESILRRLRTTNEFIKKYKEAMDSTNNVEEGDVEDDADKSAEEEEQQLGESTVGEASLHVPAVSAEAEKLLRCSAVLHRETAELRAFLRGLLPEAAQRRQEGLHGRPELEEPSVVRQMLSPSKRIAERREELKTQEEYPEALLPDDIQTSLNTCIQILSSDRANGHHCLDLLPSEQLDEIVKNGQ